MAKAIYIISDKNNANRGCKVGIFAGGSWPEFKNQHDHNMYEVNYFLMVDNAIEIMDDFTELCSLRKLDDNKLYLLEFVNKTRAVKHNIVKADEWIQRSPKEIYSFIRLLIDCDQQRLTCDGETLIVNANNLISDIKEINGILYYK